MRVRTRHISAGPIGWLFILVAWVFIGPVWLLAKILVGAANAASRYNNRKRHA